MNSAQWIMLSLLTLCAGAAFVNWRHAIFLTIVLDAVRDPLRKVTPDQPVWMSQAISIVWVLIFINCLTQGYQILPAIRRTFPRTREGTFFLIMALIPGAILSMFLYRNGWILVVIGALSYLGPLLGLVIGVSFADRESDIYRFMRIYVLVNSVVLIGSIAEHSGWNWPGLGGLIGFEWIRHMPGVLVRMVSGFFRSPDIAGFHAAHVVVFALILSLPRSKRDNPRLYWLAPGLFALYTLFLAGRRKMFSIPVIFLVVWILLDLLRRKQGTKNVIILAGVALLMASGAAFYFVDENSDLDHHQIYLSTTIYDIVPKLYEHSFQGSIVTVNQSGLLGSGLGVVTQGAQYAGVDRTQAWQEDGVSRLFKELGVIGVFFFVFAGIQYAREAVRAFGMKIKEQVRVILQNAGIAIFIANAACFAVSHQHISGDAANGILPLLFLGGLFGHILGEQRTARRAVQTMTLSEGVPNQEGKFSLR